MSATLPLSTIVDKSYQKILRDKRKPYSRWTCVYISTLSLPAAGHLSRATSLIPHHPFLCSPHRYHSSLFLVKLTLSSDRISHGYGHCDVFILVNIGVLNSNSVFCILMYFIPYIFNVHVQGVCISYFSVAVLTHHDQRQLKEGELTWAYDSKGIRVHYGGETWQQNITSSTTNMKQNSKMEVG